jgi:hypothetical protein
MTTVRRVRRIIRKIDPWTALKVSSVVWAVLGLGLVLGIVIFWSVLERAGIPDKFTDFLIEITLIGSVVWWVLMTGFTTAMALVYNLVSDVVGGLEVVVLEETLNPVVVNPQPVLHPPADYRNGNGVIVPPDDQADIPTEESPPITTS